MSKLPGGPLLRGGRDCIFPVEVRPFLTDEELALKGHDWEQLVHMLLSERLREVADAGSPGTDVLPDIGYEESTTDSAVDFVQTGWPTYHCLYGEWSWESIESLILLMKELDMGE